MHGIEWSEIVIPMYNVIYRFFFFFLMNQQNMIRQWQTHTNKSQKGKNKYDSNRATLHYSKRGKTGKDKLHKTFIKNQTRTDITQVQANQTKRKTQPAPCALVHMQSMRDKKRNTINIPRPSPKESPNS